LADRGRGDRLDGCARVGRLPRRGVRHQDRGRGPRSRKPRLDRQHHSLRRAEARGVMSGSVPELAPSALEIDAERVTEEIVTAMRSLVGEMRRRGAVVAVSGGIDSSVTAALAARAFGPRRTLALLMPEADSDDATLDLSRSVTDALGVDVV